MAYTIKINTGSGLVTFTTAEFDKGTLNKSKTGQNEVVTFDGVIRFTGSEYVTLKGLVDSVFLPCELYNNTTHLEIDGNVDLRGKYNESEEYCELKLIQDTPNEQFIRYYTEELQPLKFSPSVTATLFEYKTHLAFYYRRYYSVNSTVTYLDSAPSASTNFTLWYDSLLWQYDISVPPVPPNPQTTLRRSVEIYAREELYTTLELANTIIASGGGWSISEDLGSGNVIVSRNFTDAGYSAPGSLTTYKSIPNWSFISNNSEYIDETNTDVCWYFNDLQYPSVPDGIGCPAENSPVWMDLDSYYNVSAPQYRNFRNVTELIRDWSYYNVPDLYFDSESFEFEDFTYDNPNDYPFANLLIASIQDVIPASGGITQKSGLNKNLKTTMKDVLNWLANNLSFYWYIEKISDVYYFRLKHFSQITDAASGVNLTTLGGENWSEDGEIYTYDSNIKREIRRNMLSGSVDFVDNSILFNKFKDLTKEKTELDGNKILTDLTDIWTFPAKYPSTSDSQMFMCACVGRSVAVGPNQITGWFNIDLPTYASSATDVSGTGAGSCESNTFTVSAGTVYLFEMTGASVDNILQVEVSSNTYNPFKVIRKNMHRILLIARDSSAGAKITLTNTSGSFELNNVTCALQTETQRTAVGEISGSSMPNGDLALSKLNRYNNIYDLADSDINVNGSDITGNKGKKRKLEVAAPFKYIQDIDLHETMIHDLGAVDVDSVSIPMDGSFAKLSCKY